ncbi:GNAT family N-acetyltransferase [Roseateles sp. PN1]|uniref:GNAT family N-acetyltransferase n=1 Tax=Roseateles sp. PN1 TaxID=3137372 RepID=UPI0031397FDC
MLVLTTERLRLRWFESSDAPYVLAQLLEPSWIKNIRDPGVHDLAAAQSWMEEKLFAGYWASGLGLWAVERASDGQVLGMCGLLQRDYLPAPDIGYAFLPRFWGQGYAREAAAACLAYARDVLGQQRLFASTALDNAPSQKVLQSIGFRHQEDVALEGNPGLSRLFIWEDTSTATNPEGSADGRAEDAQIQALLQRFSSAFNNGQGRVPQVSALPFWMLGRAAISLGEGEASGCISLREFMRQRAELLGPGGPWTEYEQHISSLRLERHGQLAHAWLNVQISGCDAGQAFASEGLQSIQLLRQGRAWKIAALAGAHGR